MKKYRKKLFLKIYIYTLYIDVYFVYVYFLYMYTFSCFRADFIFVLDYTVTGSSALISVFRVNEEQNPVSLGHLRHVWMWSDHAECAHVHACLWAPLWGQPCVHGRVSVHTVRRVLWQWREASLCGLWLIGTTGWEHSTAQAADGHLVRSLHHT